MVTFVLRLRAERQFRLATRPAVAPEFAKIPIDFHIFLAQRLFLKINIQNLKMRWMNAESRILTIRI
jgi:hypothetical protein